MNIAVLGARGRVGSKTAEIAAKRGHNVWEIDADYQKNPLERLDGVIDFSVAEATELARDLCMKYRCPLVSGVTGRNEKQTEMLEALKKQVTVAEKANFSCGMTVFEKVCEKIAAELRNWDCEIVETHRKGKRDCPSGTAKMLAGKIAAAKGSFSSVTVHSRRLGSCFGTHEITFATQGESITLTHSAENVEIFALGAVKTLEEIVNGK